MTEPLDFDFEFVFRRFQREWPRLSVMIDRLDAKRVPVEDVKRRLDAQVPVLAERLVARGAAILDQRRRGR